MAKKKDWLWEADRKMRKFFRQIWQKIQKIPTRLREIGQVIAYLARHPKEIRRFLPKKAQWKRFGKKLGTAVLSFILILIIINNIITIINSINIIIKTNSISRK